MANANARLAQEVTRLGGHYAHVHDESIDTRHDDAAGETWLRGRFSVHAVSEGAAEAVTRRRPWPLTLCKHRSG